MEEKGVAHSESKEYTVNGARKMGDTLGSRIPDSCLTLSSNSVVLIISLQPASQSGTSVVKVWSSELRLLLAKTV